MCFGDSLALPREGCPYDETWISKLKKMYPNTDFICNFLGGMLIGDLSNFWWYMKHVGADVVVIQEGVCDSSPRYVNDRRLLWKVVLALCGKIRITSLFWWLIKKGNRNPSCTYTPISVFEKKYHELLNDMYCSGVKYIVIIKIGHGSPNVVCRNKYFNSNADLYNNIFEKFKEKYKEKLILIDPLNIIEDDMTVDGYHCNAKGMEMVFSELVKVLNTING